MAKRCAEGSFTVASNRRGHMYLKELAALRLKVRSFSMLDKNVWTDFLMKLEKLQETAGMHVAYAPYCPVAASVKDRGFKAFLQVSA